MFKLNHLLTGALTFIALILAQTIQAQSVPAGIKNVVFVHGAFADGSSWSKVVPLLESRGLTVFAVQNPLTSLADDVAGGEAGYWATRWTGSVNWSLLGGVVISEAGNDPNVAGLVYVAAFAPDDAQSLVSASQNVPPAPGLSEAKPDGSGFLSLTRKGIHEDFAQDLPMTERNLIWATQGP